MNSEEIPPVGFAKVLEAGPFAGVKFPHISAKANALYVFRELLHSFLITHPHLDHISAMSINTPALEYGREAKAIVALPSTIDAIKTHIFNDVIWPNLSDEGHGVGFVTYRRLIEGGNPRLGYGEARGYVNVCDGLAIKCWGVSHGKCHRQSHSSSHQRGDSYNFPHDGYNATSRRMSRISDDHGYVPSVTHQQAHHAGLYPPGHSGGTPGQTPVDRDQLFEPVSSSAFFIRNDVTGQEILIFGDTEPDSVSMFPRNAVVWDDAAPKIAKGRLKAIFIECSFNDSVRNEDLYGHLCPRHLIAELTTLARRVVECKQSSDEAAEAQVEQYRRHPSHDLQMMEPPTPSEMRKKRKRAHVNGDSIHLSERQDLDRATYPITGSPLPHPTKIPAPNSSPDTSYIRGRGRTDRSVSASADEHSLSAPSQAPIPSSPLARPRKVSRVRATTVSSSTPASQLAAAGKTTTIAGITSNDRSNAQKLSRPLKGVTVHVIHIKDTLTDGPSPGDIIAIQLEKGAEEIGLGCDFDVTSGGESIWI